MSADEAALSRCPACRAPCDETQATCICGADLETWRRELRALMAPKPGALVLPFGLLRRLPPQARRALARAMTRARDSQR